MNLEKESFGNGWIKLYRKIQNKAYYKKSHYIHLWVHLLLNANHEEKEFMWNNKIIMVKEGQLITGRKQLSEKTGIAESTIEKILKCFETEHQIEQQKNNLFRLITITCWDDYQGVEQQKEQRRNNAVTTPEQQRDTNKNNKNNKKYKNIETEDKIQTLWIKTFGKNPNLPEREETEKLIEKFGYDKVLSVYRKASLNGFHNLGTLIRNLDEEGNIIPKDGKQTIKSLEPKMSKELLELKRIDAERNSGH